MKLIAFINPEKFKNIFKDTTILTSIGYTKQVAGFTGNKSEYLGKSDLLSLSNKNLSIIEVKDITTSKDRIFIIPDNKIAQVKDLEFPYKILFHSETQANFASDLKRLIDKSLGFKLSYEEANTIYGDLVNAIATIHSKKEADLNFIDSKIRTTDPIQEAKLKLKNEIINGSMTEKVVDELKEFQSALDEFRKCKNTDIFSTEYTTAFSKFLLDLKMEA
jgi:hypothetical protein